MKKLVTLLLSLVMLCALAMPAMAADLTYSITINGAVKGHTYTAYQVFKGVYYQGNRQVEGKDAEYLSDVDWGDDVKGDDILNKLKNNTTLKEKFKDVDSAEEVAYVLQTMGNKSAELDEFARIVGENLKAEAVGKSVKVEADTNVTTITGLSAGYYLVKDTGTINNGEIATKFLVKVVGDAIVKIKAEAPTIDKKIIVDKSETNHTSANIGDQVDFKLTAKVPDMASFDSYTFTISDTLSKGLTFNKSSVAVKISEKTGDTALNADTDYKLTPPANPETDNTFTIEFNKTQLTGHVKHDTGATIVVTYNATLNSNALTTDKETNTAKLIYSNNPAQEGNGTTPDVPTYIYNFNIDVDKYDGTDGTATGKKLKDAEFVLFRLNEANNKEYYSQDTSQDTDSKKVTWVDDVQNATKLKTKANGKTTFEGLKDGIYYLEEIKAPDGYNKLKEPVKVEIKPSYTTDGSSLNTAACKLTKDAAGKHYYQIESIANKAGAVLPSTGGIGTTIFYVLGSILVLGAAVLLIVKKRMKDQER